MTTTAPTTSVFAKYEDKSWPHKYAGTILVTHLVGGTPTDQRAIEGWIKKNLGADNTALIQEMVTQTMTELGVDMETAAGEVAKTAKLNGFKRDAAGLYIEGRQLKACIKEATSVAVAAGKLPKSKWGETNKGALGFVAEHVCVVEDRLPLGRVVEDGIQQRFVSTWRGTGIQNEEYVEDVKLDFTIKTDHKFSDEHWAMIWLTAEQQGIGATRSQGYGRFTVTRWETLS